jgi:DNA-binding NarL/FixJ family response regulator
MKIKVQITVLLVDDHAVFRDGLRVLLEQSADIRVVGEAADGREAVELTQILGPDVVIMDITMRELNGIEATHLLRELCPATRVVMLSMHSNSEHVFRSLEAGATGFVLKESAGEEVAAAVRAVYAGHRYFSRAIAAREATVQLRAGGVSPLDSLSARERHVLQLVAEGHSSAEIAATLRLSPKTIETYRGRLMKKLRLKNVAALVKFAIEHGLTPLK